MTPAAEEASAFETGKQLETLGDALGAIRAYWRSVHSDTRVLESCKRLAILYAQLCYLGRSRWYARRAAKLSRFAFDSLKFLARAEFRSGRIQASLRTYRLAMRRSPDDPALHSTYLFTYLHDSGVTAASLKAENAKWFARHGGGPDVNRSFANSRIPSRKLRVGYVCAEFLNSLQVHFLLPVLQHHNREQFEVYGFHAAGRSDELTELFQKHTDVWRDVGGMGPDEIREQILRDEIDVLVERSAHMCEWKAGLAFQQRAAPVQVAYVNYPCTTGCATIDYFISDKWTTPDDEFAKQYSEEAVYRMPSGYLLYAPEPDAPQVTELPAIRNGYVTFGLFQRPAKYNDAVWDAVAGVLLSVHGSRLLVQAADSELEEPSGELRTSIIASLERRGITQDRLTFKGVQVAVDYLRVVSSVDIALDTFPYSGETTTCACLWMGVPVITCPGAVHASRVSGAIVSRVGLSDWVAESAADYVAIAVAKSGNLVDLAQLRADLRQQMAESSVCRADIVVRELEQAYRTMWEWWCAESTGEQDAAGHPPAVPQSAGQSGVR